MAWCRPVQESRAVAEKPRDAAANFDTYRNLQRHRAVLHAIARLLLSLLLLLWQVEGSAWVVNRSLGWSDVWQQQHQQFTFTRCRQSASNSLFSRSLWKVQLGLKLIVVGQWFFAWRRTLCRYRPVTRFFQRKSCTLMHLMSNLTRLGFAVTYSLKPRPHRRLQSLFLWFSVLALTLLVSDTLNASAAGQRRDSKMQAKVLVDLMQCKYPLIRRAMWRLLYHTVQTMCIHVHTQNPPDFIG